MAVPRDNSSTPAWRKEIEKQVKALRLKLQAATFLTPTAPTAAVRNSTWIDTSDGNRPNVFDGTNWVPARDTTIAVAQGDATQAALAAAAAQAAAAALQIELDAAEVNVAAAQAAIATLNTTTLPALQAALDVAEADVATAQANIATITGTTLPALQVEVDAILPIGTTDITDDAITTPKLATGAITAVKIAANTITAAEIAANAITASELAANAVTAGKIAAGTIVAADIAADTITASQIATGAITAAEIAAGTITAVELAAGAVTASRLSADAIDGKTITGALFRTAASGGRVEIDSTTWAKQVRFYTGNALETAPGIVQARIDDMLITGPEMSGVAPPAIRFYSPLGVPTVEVTQANFIWGAPDAQVVTTPRVQTLTNKNLRQASNTMPYRAGFGTFTGSGAANTITIPHGFGATPLWAVVTLHGTTLISSIASITSTNIVVNVINRDAAGAGIGTGNIDCSWVCGIATA